MNEFRERYDWQAERIPLVQDILNSLPVGIFNRIQVAPPDVDLTQNGDLVFEFAGKHIAMRLRRPHRGYFYAYGLQFTIRTRTPYGGETELSKIRRGLGDLFFYGHIEEGWRE